MVDCFMTSRILFESFVTCFSPFEESVKRRGRRRGSTGIIKFGNRSGASYFKLDQIWILSIVNIKTYRSLQKVTGSLT